MNPALMGYESAVLDPLDSSARQLVADELTALDAAVIDDPMLRAALTDTSIGATARRAIVADLLQHKVGPATARIAAFAAASSSAPDVPLSVTQAAERARAVAAEGPVEEPAVPVLASRARVGGYATAILENEGVEALEGVEDELFSWARAVQENAALRQALTNRDLPAGERAAIARDLLGGRVSSVTRALASYAIIGGRARDLVGLLDWLVDWVAAERGWRVARVHSARTIDDATRSRLAETLRGVVGHPVELEVAEQPSLLGGVIVEVGDLRVDASAKGRLDALREQLTRDRQEASGRATSSATQGAT